MDDSNNGGRENSKKKHIVLIRHGCSYMNEYIGENGITFGGPNFTDIFKDDKERDQYYRDSPLSPKGRDQAMTLQNDIQSILHSSNNDEKDGSNNEKEDSCGKKEVLKSLELIVTSPLTRAIQTAELALLPHFSALDSDADGKGKGPQTTAKNLSIPMIALPLAAERLYLVSDIGWPRSKLRDLYGHFVDFDAGFPSTTSAGSSEEKDDDPWWYQHNQPEYQEWRPTGQDQAYSCQGEPYDAFQQRMIQLCKWLEERPESTIALVGHFGVFEWLLETEKSKDNGGIKFGNCEMKVVAFEMIQERATNVVLWCTRWWIDHSSTTLPARSVLLCTW